MSGSCDGKCDCACGWQQDHPYSQRCVPTCMLNPQPHDLPDLGATLLPPEANTAPNLATSPSESGNPIETLCPGPNEAHYWLGGTCPWCKAAV